MNYLSTKETADLWNLSARRITLLASSGRIPGAKLVGKTWLIPENATKPVDARYKKENLNKDEYFFPMLIFIYDSYETAAKSLSASQLELFKAQKNCVSGNFQEADILLTKILNSTNNICTTIGALYFKIYTDIFFNNQESLFKTYTKIQQIDLSQIKNKEELSLILLDMKGILYGNKEYIDNFKINHNYDYSPESLPYLILLESYTLLITAYTSNENLKPIFFETAFIFMKQRNHVYSETILHMYIGMMFKINNDIDNYIFHIQQALRLAEKNEFLLPFIFSFKFMQNEIMNYIQEFPLSVINKIPELALTFHENSDKILHKKNIIKLYFNLTNDELNLIENARLGLTNKEIAKLNNISESYVSKKYFQLCKKAGAATKKELVNMFIESMKI